MKLLIYGAGGFGIEVAEIVQQNNSYHPYDDIYFVDSTPDKINKKYFGIPVIGTDEILKGFNPNEAEIFVAISDPVKNRNISSSLQAGGHNFATIIDSTAVIRKSAKIGSGVFIGPLVVIACNAVVENHVFINTGALVGHDSIVHRYCNISPHVVIPGDVKVGEGVEIGSSSIIHRGINIGDWSKIGMGSIVYRTIPSNHFVSGKPAKTVSSNAHDWYNGEFKEK